MLEEVLERILPKHKQKIMNHYLHEKYKYKLHSDKDCTKNADVFLLGTPEYGNLGDHAIAAAEGKLLNDIGKKYYEITSPSIMYAIDEVKKIVKDKDIIITGGGFLGNIWMNEEMMVRQVVKNFPNNKIIIFPQTIFYEKTQQGNEEKNITFDLYKKHKKLHIYAREERTYEFLKKELEYENIGLVPDIVLYLNMTQKARKKDNSILVCVRQDKEMTENKVIQEFLTENEKRAVYTDTVVNYRVTLKNREFELRRILQQFNNASLIVTNRLHGMIFATITSTPCICFDNLTKKVSGVYKWIRNFEYIKMVEESTTKEDLYKFIQNCKNREFIYNEKELLKDYEELIKNVRGVKYGENY